ncbi:SpoIIE family protein phosphatase [Kitasatospora paracochleata]|uniref:Serine phosphatase RsbU (Regulator of sigma subunit)/PAS domain-containing protein n=1 Tax=Kitasatospora paracochleata TaxID=58354 RepID=A0ABT1J372_9ACTN|nr:SpoIIE family protein phosphatase [Kitasatospora paracochleata]MCP2311880.1 serine phosphatase RsbU (regulator of sigma subunit)/PAS domain-containing protein [Kitasatospora paracochleata]
MTEDTVARPVLEATVDRLRAEIEGLRLAMRTRGVIEQAKGLLIARLSCTPDEAFRHLREESQRTNRRVVDIAAELLGVAAPPDAPDPAPSAAASPGGTSAAPPLAPAVGPSPALPEFPPQGFAARFHLAASALTSADTPDDLARLLHEVALAPLGVGAVVLALLEPDGALRITGSHGVPAQQLSQWQRIPPRTALPLAEAAHLGTTVWVDNREDFAARYPDLPGEDLIPGRTVCALPLRTGRRLIGAMKLGWPEEYHADRAAARYLSALSRLVAAELPRVLSGGPEDFGSLEPASEPWFRAVLDALLDPVLILGAIRETSGKVTDLRVEHANAATVDLAGRTGEDLVGRRLTELYPGMAAGGTLDRLLDVAASGTPYEAETEQFVEIVGGALHASAMTLHATPFLDGVLVSWRTHDEQERRSNQLAQAQRLARLGTWSWSPGSDGITCSAETLRLLGLEDETGPLTAQQALAAVAPTHRSAVRAAAAELLAGQTPVTLEFEVPARSGYRSLRSLAEATLSAVGPPEVVAVAGVVQDVTPWRRAEQALSSTRDQLAEQRRRTRAEHLAFLSLQHALMEAPTGPLPPGLETAARYLPAERESQVGGDWYDIMTVPDGTVLVVVGDVSGHGLRAAAGMAQLRHALRGIAHDGVDPAQALDRLNRMLCHQRVDFIATALCGRLDPRTRILTWARAGHLPPVLARPGSARTLDLPEGLILGVTPRARYRTAQVRLAPEETLLAYTDGLVERRGTDLGTGVGRLLDALREYRATSLDGCLDHLLRRLDAPNPLDDTCVVGLRLR